MGFPGGSEGKESACNVGDLRLIPGLGRSLEGGHGNTLQYSCLENPNGQRSLAGYIQLGRKELDKTATKHSTAYKPTPQLFPGEFHGQRSLMDYSPWSRKESDMTEQLNHHHSVQLLSRSGSSRPHELQHARPPCPTPTPGVHSNSRPSSR